MLSVAGGGCFTGEPWGLLPFANGILGALPPGDSRSSSLSLLSLSLSPSGDRVLKVNVKVENQAFPVIKLCH